MGWFGTGLLQNAADKKSQQADALTKRRRAAGIAETKKEREEREKREKEAKEAKEAAEKDK